MIENMNIDVVKEEMALCPGGDIRQRGNKWLRTAFIKSKIKRVPREAEFRKLIKHLADTYKLCAWVGVCFVFLPTCSIECLFLWQNLKYDMCERYETLKTHPRCWNGWWSTWGMDPWARHLHQLYVFPFLKKYVSLWLECVAIHRKCKQNLGCKVPSGCTSPQKGWFPRRFQNVFLQQTKQG